MCWVRIGCQGVGLGSLGVCAECAARVERRAVTISYRTRQKLDRSQRRYVKLRGKCRAAETRAAKKEKAAEERAAKRKAGQGAKA